MTDELKPCAFCLSIDITVPPHSLACVYCRTCGARAVDLERWNTRAAPDIAELEAENAQLKAMQEDDSELLTIAYMSGSHRSTAAHRDRIAQQDAVIAELVEALEYCAERTLMQSSDYARDVNDVARQALAKAKESRDD